MPSLGALTELAGEGEWQPKKENEKKSVVCKMEKIERFSLSVRFDRIA